MKQLSLGLRYALLGIVLVVALVVGSGLLGSGSPSSAARAAALDARLKCPSCQGLSVAQSNSPSSVAIRAEVRRRVDAGESDQQVVDALRARYGDAVLLTPPAGGLSVLLWLVPLILVAAVTIIVIVSLLRRRPVR